MRLKALENRTVFKIITLGQEKSNCELTFSLLKQMMKIQLQPSSLNSIIPTATLS